MRDLFVARPRLGPFDSLVASAILARPTDGDQDPGGDGYRGPSPQGVRPADLRALRRPRRRRAAVAAMGAAGPSGCSATCGTTRSTSCASGRRPGDRRRGGDSRFDVYLAELGNRGLFGYCTPERRVRGERFAASSYCVLDNDFARRQFGEPRGDSLRVTAAHEFFHAIQFGYDFREDPWLLESTATWIEETFADRVDDNRRYLRFGTVRRPARARSTTSPTTATPTTATGPGGSTSPTGTATGWCAPSGGSADTVGDAPDRSSIDALEAVLDRHAGLARTLTSYAVANLSPADSLPRGEPVADGPGRPRRCR